MTPREFVHLVAGTSWMVIGAADSDTYRPGAASRAVLRGQVRRLTAHVHAHPRDAVGYRTLGVAYFHAGRRMLAARYLETAAELLLCSRRDVWTLSATLRACLELKLIAVILACLDRELAKGRVVRRFLIEVLLGH